MSNFILIYAMHLLAFYLFILWGIVGLNMTEPKSWKKPFRVLALESFKFLLFISPLVLWPTIIIYGALNK
jgi:hypothetical protein